LSELAKRDAFAFWELPDPSWGRVKIPSQRTFCACRRTVSSHPLRSDLLR
jgi:hypothetical protein